MISLAIHRRAEARSTALKRDLRRSAALRGEHPWLRDQARSTPLDQFHLTSVHRLPAASLPLLRVVATISARATAAAVRPTGMARIRLPPAMAGRWGIPTISVRPATVAAARGAAITFYARLAGATHRAAAVQAVEARPAARGMVLAGLAGVWGVGQDQFCAVSTPRASPSGLEAVQAVV